MKEKMAKFLQELYANLGLPTNVLNSVAGFAIVGLPDDADDATIKARAEEASVKEMLQGFQSHADKRAEDARKAAIENKNKGGKGNDDQDPTNHEDDNTPAWAKKLISEQNESIKTLTDKINALETARTTQSFDEMVARIGKELKLEGAVLDLCKAGLSSDMDEQKVRDALGAKAKVLIDNGASLGGGSTNIPNQTEEQTQKEAWKSEEEAYIAAIKNAK